MGRPLKQAFDFFPLDCDFFANDKIKALRRAHGSIGVLTYLNILCRIYGTGGCFYKCSDLDVLAEDIAEQIASKNDRIRNVSSSVRASIDHLIDHDILDRGLIEKSLMTGYAMQERYVEMSCRAKRKIDIPEDVRLIALDVVAQETTVSSEETVVNSEETAVNSEETDNSKVKVKYNTSLSNAHAHARGKNGNVFLSDEEVEDLRKRGVPDAFIDHFSDKLKSEKYTYPHHYKAILAWWSKDKDSDRWSERKPSGSPGSFDTDEFFDLALRRSYGDAYGELFGEKKEENS